MKSKHQRQAQSSLFEEIIVDNFAGGGGASMGIEMAIGRPVTIAVNHDPDAIAMHQHNHPYTDHHCESVWAIDPRVVCAGRKVGLAWFSPDCKHFSKAKGGTPVSKNIRGLAWIVLRWAGTVRPRVIMLENVEEFVDWGPVRRGKPVKSKKGETFRQWRSQLETLGYVVDHRVLRACDFGVPTIRKRFYLVARCDGEPITWPTPTHGDPKGQLVQSGELLPWRTAAECIDFTLPCPSIFGRKRPLAENTMQRIARGMDKFVVKNPDPYIVQVNHSGGFRGQNTDEPLQTVTAKNGYGLITPVMTAIGQTGGGDRNYRSEEPLRTIVSKAEQCLVAPIMTPIGYGERVGQYTRAVPVSQPLGTIVGANKFFVSAAHLLEYYGNAQAGLPVADPMHTITAKDREGLVTSHLCVLRNHMDGRSLAEPLPTVTAGAGHFAEIHTTITQVGPGVNLHRWPQVRELLNRYCGYHLAEDEVLLFWLGGCWCFISDVGLRMLEPRELYLAQGFPPDYIIDFVHNGKTYSKAAQVARCGNSVSPRMAKLLVQCNLPECCIWDISTLSQLLERVAM